MFYELLDLALRPRERKKPFARGISEKALLETTGQNGFALPHNRNYLTILMLTRACENNRLPFGTMTKPEKAAKKGNPKGGFRGSRGIFPGHS